MTDFPAIATLLPLIADFERTRAYEPRPDYTEEAATAHSRLHWALANLPDDGDRWLKPMVAVNGITYAAGPNGGVVRGRVVLNYGEF